MFLKTAELKKIMKDSLKRSGLIVGNVKDHYLVYTDTWGLYIEDMYASNKFKAAIMELIGDLPEAGECYWYAVVEKEINQEAVLDYQDPYQEWMKAKDTAVVTPVKLSAWPHEYFVIQRKSDKAFMTVRSSLTAAVISSKELTEGEGMPGRPCLLGQTLYFKNESTIWWVATESVGHKAEEVLFPHLSGMDFFESEWLEKEEEEKAAAETAILPYE